MLVDLNSIPDTARVWIFPSSRMLKTDEMEQLNRLAASFIDSWTAHNQTLHAAFTVSHQLFLVFAVDETTTDASGCSLDKLHHFVKGCEQRFNIRLFDRLKVMFPHQEEVRILSIGDVEEKLSTGEIRPDDQVFDTTITSMSDFRQHFIREIQHTWLNRYLTV